MGAWSSVLDNDTANDWAYGLDDVEDLSLVESALNEVVDVGGDYLDQDTACNARAACEFSLAFAASQVIEMHTPRRSMRGLRHMSLFRSLNCLLGRPM